jgi:hypothetical protein
MKQWSDGRPDGMARLSEQLAGNRNLRSAKSSESALNSEIPVYSIFTYTSDFVQTQNEAKILTFFMSYLIHALDSVRGTIYSIPHIFSWYLEKLLPIFFFWG